MRALSIEGASCHLFGAKNFEVTPESLGNLLTPVYNCSLTCCCVVVDCVNIPEEGT